jgi:hypothetical protein
MPKQFMQKLRKSASLPCPFNFLPFTGRQVTYIKIFFPLGGADIRVPGNREDSGNLKEEL